MGFHANRTLDDGGQNIQEPRFKPTYDNDVNNLVTAAPIFANPLLLPLSDNGGPNRTMGIQAGSPTINVGTAADTLPTNAVSPASLNATSAHLNMAASLLSPSRCSSAKQPTI